jgi:hypothetical protein
MDAILKESLQFFWFDTVPFQKHVWIWDLRLLHDNAELRA